MKSSSLILACSSLAMALAACAWFPLGSPGECGQMRWDEKILLDAAAREINYSPRDTTIRGLTLWPDAETKINEARRGEEKQTYRVTCKVMKYTIESDGDLHLVIADPSYPTAHFVAEIPDTSCAEVRASGHANEYGAARAAIMQLFKDHPPDHTLQTASPQPLVEIVGVAFYDPPHPHVNLENPAENHIELHPVLSVRVLSR